jgi:hypothetical protein
LLFAQKLAYFSNESGFWREGCLALLNQRSQIMETNEEGNIEHLSRGERRDKMVQALDKATEKTLASCTRKLFLGCYPPELTSKHEDIFNAAHERFLAILQTNIAVRFHSKGRR